MQAKNLVMVTVLWVAMSQNVYAQDRCYTPQYVDGNLNRNGSQTNSADFAVDCKGTAGKVVLVEIPCPVAPVNPNPGRCTHVDCGKDPPGSPWQ